MDLEVFSVVEPILLSSCPLVPDWDKCKGNVFSLGIAESEGNQAFCRVVGFKEEFMALLIAVEASHSQKELASSS